MAFEGGDTDKNRMRCRENLRITPKGTRYRGLPVLIALFGMRKDLFTWWKWQTLLLMRKVFKGEGANGSAPCFTPSSFRWKRYI